MNAKKMFGLLFCAIASAAAISTYANTSNNWFKAQASGSTLTLTTATTNGVEITVAEDKITLDNDYSSAFSVKPETASPALNDGLVTISSSAYLAPCAFADLPAATTITDAQVGFATAYENDVTNYYYYARTGASAGSWTKWDTPTVPAPQTDTAFTITLDYRTSNAVFTVGANSTAAVAFVPVSDATLTDVAAFGSGTISSIDAKYEVGVVSYDSKLYGSVADAKTAGGTASNINYINESGEAVSPTAANGMSAAVCVALGLPTTVANTNITVAPPATDTDAANITLAVALPANAESNAVKFTVNDGSSSTEYMDASAIKIPLSGGTKTYTITPGLR